MPQLNPFHREIAAQYVATALWAATIAGIGLAAVLLFWLYNTIRPEAWPDRDAVTSAIIIFVATVVFVFVMRQWMSLRRGQGPMPVGVASADPPKDQQVTAGPYYGGSDVDIDVPTVALTGNRRRGEIVGLACSLKQGNRVLVRDLPGVVIDGMTGTSTLRIPREITKQWKDGWCELRPSLEFADGSHFTTAPFFLNVRAAI
jgi:hypothetical protein